MILFIVAKGVTGNLVYQQPPESQSRDRGELRLMRAMGKMALNTGRRLALRG